MCFTAFFSPAIPLGGVIQTQSEHSGPAGCTGCVPPSECGRGCGSESKTRALSSVLPTLLNRSIRLGFRCFGTSMGHRLFLGSYFLPLGAVQRLR
jgi:hypothetical protein